MTSGLLTLVLIAATGTTDSAGDLEKLLAAVSPAGETAELHFIEERHSPLLSEPLEVTGRMWRNSQGHLIRQTSKPREATYTLTANMVIIEQPGRSPRNHSLSHIPELAVLYHGLSALLAGDAEALRERFEYQLARDGENGWQLRLAPRDPALSAQVDSLSLAGRGDKLERFVLSLADGESIETKLVGRS